VAACAIAHVIVELPVGVYAATRHRGVCSQRGKAGNLDLRQAKILRGYSVIQPDAGGIKGLVLGRKFFFKAIVAAAYLHEELGVKTCV